MHHPDNVVLDDTTLRLVCASGLCAPMLRWDVADAVTAIETAIRTGAPFPPRAMIMGFPLCEWLGLDGLGRLLLAGQRPGRPGPPRA